LISESWIDGGDKAADRHPAGEITYGYGHQIWMTARKGAFLFNGAFGQYMLAIPDLDVIVVLFSGTSRLFAQGGVLDYVTNAFDGHRINRCRATRARQDALETTISALSARSRPPFYKRSARASRWRRSPRGLRTASIRLKRTSADSCRLFCRACTTTSPRESSRSSSPAQEGGALAIEMVEGEHKHHFTLRRTAIRARDHHAARGCV
jgi:hypothetical protein